MDSGKTREESPCTILASIQNFRPSLVVVVSLAGRELRYLSPGFWCGARCQAYVRSRSCCQICACSGRNRCGCSVCLRPFKSLPVLQADEALGPAVALHIDPFANAKDPPTFTTKPRHEKPVEEEAIARIAEENRFPSRQAPETREGPSVGNREFIGPAAISSSTRRRPRKQSPGFTNSPTKRKCLLVNC